MPKQIKEFYQSVDGRVEIEYDDNSVVKGMPAVYSENLPASVMGLVGPNGTEFLVVSNNPPNDADGRSDGTIYIQTA